MKIKIFAVLFFTGLFWVKGDIPSEIILNDDVSVPLINNGKQVGTMKIKSGTTVKVSEIIGDSLKIKHINSETTVLKSKTNFNDILKQKEDLRIQAETQRKEEEVQTQKVKLEQKEKDEEKKIFDIYIGAKKTLEHLKNRGYSINQEDEIASGKIKTLTECFITSYESNVPQERGKLALEYLIQKNDLLKNCPCYAEKYNEFVKKLLPTPIKFNVYSDSNDFYIQVGDGAFCTIATVELSDILNLLNNSRKINDWFDQCLTEGLDTNKEIGSYGNIGLELVSRKKGTLIWISLKANGETTKDRLIEEQSVMLTKLNWDILTAKLTQVNEIFNERENRKNNAEKLR